MEAESRNTGSSLIDALRDQPHRFGFLEAVRILRASGAARNGSLRFRAAASMRFPHAPVLDLTKPAAGSDPQESDAGPDASPWEMTVAFFGLTGPCGALPEHDTADLIEQLRQRPPYTARRDFLDLFNDRLIELFEQAARKHCFPLAYEQASRDRADDLLSRCLWGLAGLGSPGLRRRSSFRDEIVLHFAGHFARHPRSAAALERMIEKQFGVPAHVLQFQGRWLPLSEPDRSRFPDSTHPMGRNAELGVSTVCGERVWDVQSAFRIRLGPLSLDQYRRLTPDGDRFRPLCDFVRLYAGAEFDFDIQPVLRASEVRGATLGGGSGGQLGWTTWTGRTPDTKRDFDGAVFADRAA